VLAIVLVAVGVVLYGVLAALWRGKLDPTEDRVEGPSQVSHARDLAEGPSRASGAPDPEEQRPTHTRVRSGQRARLAGGRHR